MMANNQIGPEAVWTPRRSEVNSAMYVERPEIEKQLERFLRQNTNILIHGESGSGKSWLYRSVLDKLRAKLAVGNLANASRLGSITAEIKNLLNRDQEATKVGYDETKKVKASACVLESELEHQAHYHIGELDPFEALVSALRKKAGSRATVVLALDNLEAIRDNDDLMQELANLIILLDDERYARHSVKLLLVGVPGDVRSYFNKTPNRQTVVNRLSELREVSRLTHDQARELIIRGFEQQLSYNFESGKKDKIVNHVIWVTDRIPQRIHEYCLELAYLAEDCKYVLHENHLVSADARWLSNSLSNSYSVIEKLMNGRETRIGRRNQVLYALGQSDEFEIRYTSIEEVVRRVFPASTDGRTLNISGILSELSSDEAGLLKRSPKGDSYVFLDPKYRMCLRSMLVFDKEAGRVLKRTVEESGEGINVEEVSDSID
jgi:Cdc6-like AAA superfamily ATPase